MPLGKAIKAQRLSLAPNSLFRRALVPKPNQNVIAPRQPAVQNRLESSHHPSALFFSLPSFLPLLVIPEALPSLSHCPLLSFFQARSQVTRGFLRSSLPILGSDFPPSFHPLVKKPPAVSLRSSIIDAFCAPCSAGVGVNFHSAGDVNGKCNSHNDATAVASTLPCS